jgi:gliding motility-associated-like protein
MKYNPCFFALLSLVFFPLLLSGQDTEAGLLVYYPLDGNLLDASGNAVDGVDQGVTYGADRFGNSNSAAQFDGNGWVEMGSGLQPGLPVTLSCWVYFEALPTGGRAILTTDFSAGRYRGLTLSLNDSGQLVVTLGAAMDPASFTTNISLETDHWHHLAVIVGNAGGLSVYVSGCEESGSFSGTAAPLAYDDGLGNLGRSNAGAMPQVNTLQGRLDEFRYYGRALSEEEVNLLYDQFYTPEINLGADTMICLGESLTLEPETTVSNYIWSDGSMGITLEVTQTGTYGVEAETDDCQIIRDSIEVMAGFCDQCDAVVPNAFTPNRDGVNDTFRVLFNVDKCRIVDAEVRIFNRWGKLVFESDKVDDRWDGTFDGQDLASDVYIYFVRYTYESEEGRITGETQGDLTLLR